ncbi:MAG TPA: response regulator transcription factor [Gaiellaceae bacterium]|nr:response regulator transcription factor [Gaiellaceae bacterium]
MKVLLADAGASILVVDNDPESRAAVSKLIAGAGFSPIEATGGGEALAVARKERPALVLLEVSLPDVGGYEVCRALRDQFGNELPIVFVSGARKESDDRAAGLLIGADDYIVKPFDPQELLARLRRLLERSGEKGTRHVPSRAKLDLTVRELEVLRLLAEGVRPADIATDLAISSKTVSNHIQRTLGKLGVHTQAQAVALAYELRLVEASTPHEPPSKAV